MSAAFCQNHPQREAIGICVRCRSANCSECVTKVDGINYCVGCLAELAGQSASRSEASVESSRAKAGLAIAGWLLLLLPLYWLMVEAAMPGGG